MPSDSQRSAVLDRCRQLGTEIRELKSLLKTKKQERGRGRNKERRRINGGMSLNDVGGR